MRYITVRAARDNRVNLDVGNIHYTGSVRGMQKLYGWPKGGQVRVGSWIYNLGPAEVQRLERLGVVRG
jgi:hypothetical protein